MSHHISLKINILIHEATAQYSLQLAPNNSGIYCWYLYNQSDNILVHTYEESLDQILDILQAKFQCPGNITNDNKQTISVIAIFDQPINIYAYVGFHPIPTYRQEINIGTITLFPTNMYLTPHNNNRTQLNRNNPPTYNISPVKSLPANDAAMYLYARIPIDYIIQRNITNFPGQISTQPEILHHYSPLLPHMPCATTSLVDQHGFSQLHFSSPTIIAPQNIDYDHITVLTENNNKTFLIDPNAKYNDIAELLSHAIYQAYIEKPDIRNLSQHEKIAITRIFQQHGTQIAQNVYTTAMRHRAARLQCVIFDFPRLYP